MLFISMPLELSTVPETVRKELNIFWINETGDTKMNDNTEHATHFAFEICFYFSYII